MRKERDKRMKKILKFDEKVSNKNSLGVKMLLKNIVFVSRAQKLMERCIKGLKFQLYNRVGIH
jgi:hypothetical protein